MASSNAGTSSQGSLLGWALTFSFWVLEHWPRTDPKRIGWCPRGRAQSNGSFTNQPVIISALEHHLPHPVGSS